MEPIEKLMHFGLTRQESVIYAALFTEGVHTGYEVSKQTGISRSNTYTALAGLVEKGAARRIEGAATQYIPVPVTEFCDNKIAHLTRWKEELANEILNDAGESEGYITIQGTQHIMDKLRQMLQLTQYRVYLSVDDRVLVHFLPLLRRLVEQKRKVVLITSSNVELQGAVIYRTSRSQENQIRVITDSCTVLTGDYAEGSSATCLYSQKQNLVDVFKEALQNEIALIRFHYYDNMAPGLEE